MKRTLIHVAALVLLPDLTVLHAGAAIVTASAQEQSDRSGKMTTSLGLSSQETARINAAVTDYLAQRKQWTPDQFRVDYKAISPDGRYVIVWAVHREDETHPVPGAGQSLQLYVDRNSYLITKELGFQ
jgi:hypothetical protein